MVYSEQGIRDLLTERAALEQKYYALLFAYHDHAYRTESGREYATHGLLRRLRVLRRCVDRVFTFLPPDLGDIPDDEALEDATIALQAFVFNVFGCLDNLARIWVEERSVRKRDGSPIPLNAIGLGKKFRYVRASLPIAFEAYLQSLEAWFGHLENYRHALAHRIPLYVPPHFVKPENGELYRTLEDEIMAAHRAGDHGREVELSGRQRALMFFRPVMTHSLKEPAEPIVIHSQMLADFNTVDAIAHRMLLELKQP